LDDDRDEAKVLGHFEFATDAADRC
jgi:hypothetical protein